ncbi:MAG: nitroreductase family protein [Bacillota bacterium]
MDLESTIIGRRSVRKFTEEKVPEEFIIKLVKMAIEAPSPGNQQTWHFYAIMKSDVLQRLADIVESELDKLTAIGGVNPESMRGPKRFATWFKEAPVVIAASTRQYRSPVDNTLLRAGYTEEEVDVLRSRPDLQAVGAAIQNMLLTAYASGYGACWLTGPLLARKQLEKHLGIQPPESLAALIALGRPKYNPPRPERKPVDEFFTLLK